MIIPTIRSDPTESNQTEPGVMLSSPVMPLTCGDGEPEVGVEPTTFRLRGGSAQSGASEGDAFPQAGSDAFRLVGSAGCSRSS
jgi:hypothetical protein